MKKITDPRLRELREKLDEVESLEQFRLYLDQAMEDDPMPEAVKIARQEAEKNATSKPH